MWFEKVFEAGCDSISIVYSWYSSPEITISDVVNKGWRSSSPFPFSLQNIFSNLNLKLTSLFAEPRKVILPPFGNEICWRFWLAKPAHSGEFSGLKKVSFSGEYTPPKLYLSDPSPLKNISYSPFSPTTKFDGFVIDTISIQWPSSLYLSKPNPLHPSEYPSLSESWLNGSVPISFSSSSDNPSLSSSLSSFVFPL